MIGVVSLAGAASSVVFRVAGLHNHLRGPLALDLSLERGDISLVVAAALASGQPTTRDEDALVFPASDGGGAHAEDAADLGRAEFGGSHRLTLQDHW